MYSSLCCYIGGKAKLARIIVEEVTQRKIDNYREPFFGGGSVGLNLMTRNAVPNVWINDYDPAVYSMWTAAANYPEMLKQAVRDFVPCVSEFARIKSQFRAGIAKPTAAHDIVRFGVEKIGVQQMSRSGLGQMSGGPTGGWGQLNGGIGSRWNPARICQKIDLISHCLRCARITNLDFASLLDDDTPATIYLDPPYHEVGDKLYQHSLSHLDHVRLSELLRYSEHDWLLSYNDCPAIRELYAFAQIRQIKATYSNSRRQTHELLISRVCNNRTVVGYRPTALAA
jgi:DNA adenine methylase